MDNIDKIVTDAKKRFKKLGAHAYVIGVSDPDSDDYQTEYGDNIFWQSGLIRHMLRQHDKALDEALDDGDKF